MVLQYYTYTCDNASFYQSRPLRLKPCMDHWTKELKLSLSIRHQQQILDHLSDNTILQQLFPDPSSHRGYLKLLVLDAKCVCVSSPRFLHCAACTSAPLCLFTPFSLRCAAQLRLRSSVSDLGTWPNDLLLPLKLVRAIEGLSLCPSLRPCSIGPACLLTPEMGNREPIAP